LVREAIIPQWEEVVLRVVAATVEPRSAVKTHVLTASTGVGEVSVR